MTRLILYPIAKCAEKISIKMGYGEFKVPNHANCNLCLSSSATSPSCNACRISWVRELGKVDYTDAFERKVNVLAGGAFLGIGVCGGALNEELGLWKVGGVVEGITNLLHTLLSPLPSLPASLISPFHILLTTILSLSLLLSLLLLSTSLFFLLSAPSSPRHWKHFTPRAMVATVLLMVAYMVFLTTGTGPEELIVVVGPVLSAFYAWGLVGCMRKDGKEVVGEREGGVKLV